MNQTIYFRKDVWEKFQDEKNKSELINNLLDDWYSGKITNPMPQNKKPYINSVQGISERVHKIIKTPVDAKVVTMAKVEKEFAKADSLCPIHETPLDSRGRCLQKKCKYS